MLKKALLRDDNRNQFEPRTGFLQFYVKTKKFADVCQFQLRARAFYTWHVHNSPYSSFGRKKIEPIMYYEGMVPTFSGAEAPLPSR